MKPNSKFEVFFLLLIPTAGSGWNKDRRRELQVVCRAGLVRPQAGS